MNTDADENFAGEQLVLGPGLDGWELLQSAPIKKGETDENFCSEAYPLTTVRKNRERLTAILGALAEGMPRNSICRAYHVGKHTLAAIERKHASEIAPLKQGLARKSALLANRSVDRMLDELDSMPLNSLPVAFGVAVDKLQILTGEASAIVDHRHQPQGDWGDFLARIKRAETTGLEAADSGAKEGAPLELGPVKESSDIQSEGSNN